ncbi:MAG: multidrug ABC transporter permease [Magnetovibrio sp.]|nr:multidrug ABC transporter permease [Magnetovibrio sp.]|tara:strand:+ start:341 stop:1120 length:780 start_codon:yes stop_codon:yes gene_type:complete
MRDPAAANWIGLWTLYLREIRRFTKVYMQTLMAPVVTTLLFLAVFSLALGNAARSFAGVPLTEFLGPGLIIMAVAQNAFANTSSSLMTAKIQGNIVDTLLPPLTPYELTIGFVMGGITRGVLVGAAVTIAMTVFIDIGLHNINYIFYHGIMGAMMLALLGTIGAIWAEKYDHISAVTNFVITPLSFLSGTFYSIDRLPVATQVMAQFNPFFYMIDGFRYGFIGKADGSIVVGLFVIAAINITLVFVCARLFANSCKLRP